MRNDLDPLDELKAEWHSAVTPKLPQPSRQHVEQAATRFARQIAWRNAREWAAALLVAVIFSGWAVGTERVLVRLGCIITVVASGWIAYVLARWGRASPPNVELTTHAYLDWYRQRLDSQIQLLSSAGGWYVAPFALGTGLILVDRGERVLSESQAVGARVAVVMIGLVYLALIVGVVLANRKAASELRRQRDLLGDGE